MAKDLNYFKKKIMAILEKQTDDAPAEINKSLNQMDFIYSQMNPSTFSEIEKSRGYGIGTVREWKGRKYKKIAPNKWRLVYESNSRGAKQSIAYLKKAVMNAKSTDELLQIVMENVNRFQDANGKTLDIVSELQEAVRSAKTALNGKKEPAASKPAETKKETPKTEEKQEEVIEVGDVSKMSDEELAATRKKLEAQREKIIESNKKLYDEFHYQNEVHETDHPSYKKWIDGAHTLSEVNAKNGKIIDEISKRKMAAVKTEDEKDPEEPKPEPKKEEPKQEEKPAEPEKKADDNEDVKAEMKKWKEVFDKYYNSHNTGVGHWLDWVERPGQDVHSKAYGKAAAIKNLIAMREGLKNDYGIDTPEIPQEILDKYNEYNEKIKGVPGYAIGNDTNKILSSYKNAKLRDAFNAIMQPVKDKYFEAKNKLVTEEIPTKVEPVAGKTNKEHAELFEMRKNPNNEEEEILYYNGKPYGADGNKGYGWSNPLADQREMVEAVGMDPKAQAEFVWKKFESNPDEVGYQWSFDSQMKKYGEKKLRELAKPTMSNEEFKEKLLKECEKNTHTYKWIAGQVRGQLYNKRVEETAQKYLDKLTSSTSAINDVDIPVDPKDMEEAESIIGADVRRILDGRDTFGNVKQGLPDKIRRRVRNNPGVARAMFVYIKQEQERTGKTVFTPKHSIWEEFSKLNENAMNSVLNGESETKTGTSSNMYTGDDISSVVEDKDLGRYQITFNGKPDYDTRTILKQNGFRWAPSLGVWQCYNTGNGERALSRVAEKLGWKKDGE